jgi:hypothetical protein
VEGWPELRLQLKLRRSKSMSSGGHSRILPNTTCGVRQAPQTTARRPGKRAKISDRAAF